MRAWFQLLRTYPATAFALLSVLLTASSVTGQALQCDMSEYSATSGLEASVAQNTLTLTWDGAGDARLRLGLAVDSGQPIVRELAVRGSGGQWTTLGRNLSPEFNVTSGRRRITEQQLSPLRRLGVNIDDEIIEEEKWGAFWDAPLEVPGLSSDDPAYRRDTDEIHRASAVYDINGCQVKTDGARLEVTFPGLSLGVFDEGRLVFTVYRGANLVRQMAVAKTEEPSVAFKYSGGLKGFSADSQRVRWRDTGGDWQKYEFGGSPNVTPVALRARNRIAVVEGDGASLAVFPPPHKFFFSREVEINLGYVWYRKDDDDSFSIGIRHNDWEEVFRPLAKTAREGSPTIEARIRQARRFAEGNFALYSSPPGTWQRMMVFYNVTPGAGESAMNAALAYTNKDVYRPLDGYQVMLTHIHPPFTSQLIDMGSVDIQVPWIPALRARGVKIVAMSDFHADGHMTDPGPIRLMEQQTYFEASRRHSDRDFLILPYEEPHDYLGGPLHWNTFFPKPVYWTHVRQEGQPFVEEDPQYGTVYHVGSAEDVMEMARRENGFVYMAHQRSKGSTGYPEAIRDKDFFNSDTFLGGEYRANVPVDLSDIRMLEREGLDAMDDMNNWTADKGLQPKFIVAATDTYMKYPEDDIYPQSYVNYVKLDRVPSFDDDWTPIVQAMRGGDFFVSSGEILLKQFDVEGSGNDRTITAEFDWTFPLDFVEVVWGDGENIDREIISATGEPAYGSKRYSVPFDATGKNWVRVAAWDTAGNGAFSMPVRLTGGTPTEDN